MKKIAIFIVSSLLLIAVSASAQRVILRSNNNYDIRIDGRYYNGNNASIPYLNPGYHDVEVYQVTSGGFLGLGKRRTLVSSSRFYLGNRDVVIDVDPYGYARIDESNSWANGNRYGKRMHRRYNRNYNNNYRQ
jgi:hypothetical protein